MMYTYIYYFILNEEQRKKYIIDNVTDPVKHIRANIGEGVKPYNVFIIKYLDDNYILYRTLFTSDNYIPNLHNAQITKTFYSLQKDLYGNECREDIELYKELDYMKRENCEIKLKEDRNKVTYEYTYYFILNKDDIEKYVFNGLFDDYFINFGKDIWLQTIKCVEEKENLFKIYKVTFSSDEEILSFEICDQIIKTIYSKETDLNSKPVYVRNIALNKNLEYVRRNMFNTPPIPSKDNKFYYSYTYYFTLFNNDVNNYILHDSSGDYICTYVLNCNSDGVGPFGNYYVRKIFDNNIRTCYAVAFETKTKNSACEKDEMLNKTLFQNTGSLCKEGVRFFPSLERLYEYYKINNKETKNNMSIGTLNNYACVYAGCMTNEHIGLEIKEVKYNGPATIVFWNDGTKTVAKCQEDMSNYKAEKGLAMAISKKVIKSEYYAIKDIKIGHNDNSIIIYWEHGTEAEIKFDNHVCDPEYCIALARVKKFFGSKTKNNTKWYEKFKSYLPKEEKKPLVIDLGHLDKSKKSDTTCEDFMPKPNTHEETEQEFVLRLFNEGYSLKKISDKTGVTMYHVRRYIDEATKPDKFKNKETKKSYNKRSRTYHKLTDLEDPSWLLPEECKDIREAVKEKFKDKHMTMSLLQKEYIRECRKYKLKQCYGNGYSMYELAKIIGDTNAAGLMRIWNDMNKEGK